MKLLSFGEPAMEKPGVIVRDNLILDLHAASGGEIRSIRGLLDMGEDVLKKIEDYMSGDVDDAWLVKEDSVRIGPVVNNPTKIVCLGLNYRQHAEEQGARLPKKPLIFAKAASSLAGNNDPLWYPADETKFDYEVELAFVIGRTGLRIPEDDWESYIAGYTILNDVSARDAQFGDRKWFRGKSYDSTCPVGPYLVTRDEIPDPHNLEVKAVLNGEVRQKSNTNDLIFNIPRILEFASRNITFHPGDIIATGTPSGVGIFFDPPRCMKPGDNITVSVEKLGSLTNEVKKRTRPVPSVYPARFI